MEKVTLFLLINYSTVWVNLQFYHPPALKLFDRIIYNSKGKQIVIFLDYDGTLSPIVADPDKAFMTRKVSFFVPFSSLV